MDTIDLHTWSQWTVETRREWLYTQSPQDLANLLEIINEMIIDCPDTEKALSALAPSNRLMDTWHRICDSLADIKKSIESVLLLERAV